MNETFSSRTKTPKQTNKQLFVVSLLDNVKFMEVTDGMITLCFSFFILQLKDMEEAAKLKLQQDLEERRAKALARREENLENRSNMDKLKHSQGITKSWVFSYFVRWPLESYMTYVLHNLIIFIEATFLFLERLLSLSVSLT